MSDNGLTGEAERPEPVPLRIFGSIVSGMNATGSVWIVVLMLLINIEAIGRSAFNTPIIGVIEMIEISVVGIVFLQLADSLRRGVMTRSDGLFNHVMARNKAAGHTMAMVTYLAGAVFMGLVIWGTGPFFVDSWNKDYYIGVEGMFTAPVWPIALVIVIGLAVAMIQFLIMLAAAYRRLAGRG